MAESILKLSLIGVEEANNKINALSKSIVDQKQKQKELREEIAALAKKRKEGEGLTAKEEARLRSLTIEQAKNNAALRENNKELKQNVRVLESQEGSLNELRASLNALQTAYGKLDTSTEKGAKAAVEMKNRINDLDAEVKGLEKGIGDTRRNVGNYEEAIQNAIGSMVPFGNQITNVTAGATGLRGAFESAKAGIIGATRAAIAFIATPIGAAIAALGAITAATKAWYEYNEEIRKTNSLLAGITNQSGDTLNNIRRQTEALQKTLGVGAEETAKAAKVLVQQFGISYEEALDKMQTGILATNGANEELLQSIGEYSTFFADAGYSVDEFTGIVNAGFDLGIYTDKLPDALKEADISLREQTKATTEALTNAFGEEFTQDILNQINVGALSTKDALQLLSLEAEKTGLTAEQAATLTADVFRGAGEDAGGAIKVFEAVAVGVGGSTNALDEYGEQLQEEIERTVTLSEEMDEALMSEGFIQFQEAIRGVGQNIKLGLVDGLTMVMDTLSPVGEAFASLGRALGFTGESSIKLRDVIGITIKVAFKPLEIILNTVRKAVSFVAGAIDVAKKAFSGVKIAVINATQRFEPFRKAINKVKAAVLSFVDAFKRGFAAVQATLDGVTAYGEAVLGSLGDALDHIAAGRFIKAKNALANIGTEGERAYNRAYNAAMNSVQSTNSFMTAVENATEATEEEGEAINDLVEVTDDATESTRNYTSAVDDAARAEEARLKKLTEIIDKELERGLTQEQLLKKRLDDKLKELELDKDLTELTEQELNARLALEEKYNDDLEKLSQDKLDEKEKELRAEIADLQTLNKIKLNTLKEELNEELKAIEEGNDLAIQTEEDKEKAKKAVREEYRRLEIAQQQAHLNDLLAQYENLLAQDEIAEGLGQDLLSDQEALRVQEQISNLKTSLSALGLELVELGTDEETGEKVGAVASALGLDKKGAVKMELAVDAINQSFAVIDEAISVRAQRRLEELEAQKEAGVITTEEFEQKRRQVEYEAALAGHRTQIVNAINQATMAALNAYASTAAIPGVGAFMAPAAAAVAGAFGAAQVGLIAANKPKFSEGGILNGPSHANGGIQMFGKGGYFGEAEGGEAILTKGVMQNPALASMASAINVAAGGRPLFQDGGVIKPMQPATASDNISNLLNTVTERQPVLVVETLNKRQQSVQVTESLRTI